MGDSDQRGSSFVRIARARRATAVYLRCADARFFFRAVIAAHSRAREYAAATPRRSTLQSRGPDPDPDPKRGQIGNVFLDPKKHRRPHLLNNAERSHHLPHLPPPLTPHRTETHHTTPSFFLVFLRIYGQA